MVNKRVSQLIKCSKCRKQLAWHGLKSKSPRCNQCYHKDWYDTRRSKKTTVDELVKTVTAMDKKIDKAVGLLENILSELNHGKG